MKKVIAKKNTKDKAEKAKKQVRRKPVYSTNTSQELKKVTWPNRDTLVKSTLVIIVIVIAVTLYVGGLDYLFSIIFDALRGLNG